MLFVKLNFSSVYRSKGFDAIHVRPLGPTYLVNNIKFFGSEKTGKK